MDDQVRILEELFNSVLDGDEELARSAADASLRAGLSPLDTIDRGLTPAIREVGERFGRMELFLPEMVMSAKAMEAAVHVLEPHLAGGAATVKARVVIGTVKGDIHDIGKNIAIALFKVNGFAVVDLGRDVPAAAFVDEALKHRAQIIGISGLLTTSLPMMREVVKILRDDGLRDRFKVVIGGGPTSQEFADRIGADGYAETAYDGVLLCERLIALPA
jgi:corrinoid protein of di/trimethylamine methyltransferase